MRNIYIEDLEDLKEELEGIDENEPVHILDENNELKYILMPARAIQNAQSMLENMGSGKTEIRVITPDNQPELSYEEYEHIKKEILKTFEENFKPKPEKLN